MAEIGVEIDGDAVEGDPAPYPDADGGDLVLPPTAAVHPDADSSCLPLAPDVEPGKGADHPFLEIVDIAPQVGPAWPQVEHGIGHALARPVIGVLSAPPGPIDREASRLQ